MADKTMTPSITTGQINKATAQFRDALVKHREEFDSEAAQQVLGTNNLGMKLLEPFRVLVEAVSNLIIRKVKVNRLLTGSEAIQATGRNQYCNDDVVATMPQGEGDEVEVVFFNLGHRISDDSLDKEYELRGLTPCGPYSLAAVNETDPAFADKRPNGTHWKDANGNWCYITFYRWDDGRDVCVYRDDEWDDRWWFAGRRK